MDSAIFIVLEGFDGLFWGKPCGFKEQQNEIVEGENVARGMIFAVGVGVFAQGDILVAMQIVFNAPMLAIIAKQRVWRGFVRRQTGDEPRRVMFADPLPFFLAFTPAFDFGDLTDARADRMQMESSACVNLLVY